MKINKKYFLTGLVLVSVLIAAVVGLRAFRQTGTGEISKLTKLRMGLKTKGPDHAPIKIVEFSDFQCGACRKAQPVLDTLFKEYPGKIQIVFKHFPLPGHTWSGLAHQAAECANQRGVFWPYMDRLFADQEKWMPLPNPADQFLRYAVDLKLNVNTFANCLLDEKTRQRVRNEFAEGEALEIKSTPTFFIDNERVVGLVELEKRGNAIVRKKLGLPPLPEPPPAVAPSEQPNLPGPPASSINRAAENMTADPSMPVVIPEPSLADEKR